MTTPDVEDSLEGSPAVEEEPPTPSLLSQILFRQVLPTDIPSCCDIEKSSYPPDEAASRKSLRYRQHHAAPYFRCAVLVDEENEDEETVIGFVCSTRCRSFTHESMSVHDPSGPLLAIHSVVVNEQYRRFGIAMRMMKDYVQAIENMTHDGVETLILLAKSHLLGFYVKCGFTVARPSKIVHGKELWYECEKSVGVEKLRKQGYPCWIVDSFAPVGGGGNQAAVVLLSSSPLVGEDKTEWMKTVAKEFNHSETAFIWSKEDEEGTQTERNEFGIRYFTCNGTEVDLCGHATLASGAVLFEMTPTIKDVVFRAKNDILKVKPDCSAKSKGSHTRKVIMDFPQIALRDITAPADRSALLRILSAAFHIEETAENILYLGLDENREDVLVELTSDCFLKLGHDNINYAALTDWNGYSRGIILCCRNPARGKYEEIREENNNDIHIDFLSRFFGPKAGILEDPVTGSAHCRLGPYFAAKLEKSAVVGRQTSARGGIVECIVQADGRMQIAGPATTTMSGYLFL